MQESDRIGARLREERKRSGMTQDQLAEALGVSKRTVANYESGDSDATAIFVCHGGERLGFDTNYILHGKRATLPVEALSDVEDMIVQQYRSIPADDQAALRRFLKAMADDAAKQSN